MDKASPGGSYLVHGNGGLPQSIVVGRDEKIVLDCNSVFCVKEAQMSALKSACHRLDVWRPPRFMVTLSTPAPKI